MINSEQGRLDIEGNRGDLLLEFMHLYEGMIEGAPEIVASVILNYEQELTTALGSTDVELMHAADKIVKLIKKEKEIQ